MARPKSAPATIEETISRKIESLKSEIEKSQVQLSHWEKVQSDYEANKATIESILSVHQAPDLSAPVPKKYTSKKKETQE